MSERRLEERSQAQEPGAEAEPSTAPAGVLGSLVQRFGPAGAQRIVQRRLAQRRAQAGEPGDERHIQAAAARGTSGAGGPLPHLDAIQRSFGRHDVSHVAAHADEAAQEGARDMGAEAFASGDHVAFAEAPSLHTAAHEAAHVVQQRGGVQLKGGVGQAGDPHEAQADAVADAVVQGRSAEPLLDPLPRSSGNASPAAGPVQRKVRFSGTVYDSFAPLKTAIESAQPTSLHDWTALETAAQSPDLYDYSAGKLVKEATSVQATTPAKEPAPVTQAPATQSPTPKDFYESKAKSEDVGTAATSSDADPIARIKSADFKALKKTNIGSSRPKPVYLFDKAGQTTDKKAAAAFMVDPMSDGEFKNYQLVAQMGLRVPRVFDKITSGYIVEWVQNATTVALKQTGHGAVRAAMRLDQITQGTFNVERWKRTLADVQVLLKIGYTSRDLQFMVEPSGAICFMDLEANGPGENSPQVKDGHRDPSLVKLAEFLEACLKAGKMVEESASSSGKGLGGKQTSAFGRMPTVD